jgi:hypothetical protein
MWDVAVFTANLAEWCQPSLRREGSMTAPARNFHYDGQITRRGIFLGAAASLFCAPAIVRATNLMPVRGTIMPIGHQWAGFSERLFYHSLDCGLRTGEMRTNLNGRIIPEAEAHRLVAHARAQG